MKAKVIFISIILTACIVSCHKEINTVSSPVSITPGSISGNFRPVSSASSILAIKINSTDSTRAKLDSNKFSILGLQPGDYKLIFAAAPGFIAPDSMLITVKTGENFITDTAIFKTIDTSKTDTSKNFGSFSGVVSPASAVLSIVAVTPGVFDKKYEAIKDAAGNFNFKKLPEGACVITFITAVGFKAPDNLSITVTAGKNTDLGTIKLSPLVYAHKSIDTISDPLFVYSENDANDFATRAASDSVIVALASIYIVTSPNTPEFASALNKIISVKQIFQVNGASGVLTLSGLKQVGELEISYGDNLTTLNLPALTSCGLMDLYICPTLMNINIGSLKVLNGISFESTGLTSLSAFHSVPINPSIFELEFNKQLTSLTGLNFVADSSNEFNITGNSSLTSLDGLQGIKRFTYEATINGNEELQTLTGLNNAMYARILTLTDNPQLNNICPAKTLLDYLKSAPDFKEYEDDPLAGVIRLVTKHPLVASNNGTYATKDDLIAAVNQCH